MLWDVDSWSTFRKSKWKILLRSSFFLYLQSQQHRVGPEDQVVNLERCFHWWVNWTNSFPTVSQPCSQTPSRQPIPTGLLSVGLLCHLRPLSIAQSRLGNMGLLQNHPLAALCLPVRLRMCLYSVSTLLVYYDGCCFYCAYILTFVATVWKKLQYVSGQKA